MANFSNRLFLGLILLATGAWTADSQYIELHGILTKDAVLKPAKGKYLITGDWVIKKGVLVSILPGTQIFISSKMQASDSGISQINTLDSGLISIQVYGSFRCRGNAKKRIHFSPLSSSKSNSANRPDGPKGLRKISWYGIHLVRPGKEYTEISYSTIQGAARALDIVEGNFPIHHNIIDWNHIGIHCSRLTQGIYFNNTICNNYLGVKSEKSSPRMFSNMISHNLSHGFWGDGISKIKLEYNGFFANGDGNFLNLPPEYGLLVKVNKNKDSTDKFSNIYLDPILEASPSHLKAYRDDLNIPTGQKQVIDIALHQKITQGKKPLADSTLLSRRHLPYALSKYSPYINAGYRKSKFRDVDESINDIGVYGGNEFSLSP